MKLIFLDVDGVLNSRNKLIREYNQTHKSYSGYSYPFDEICLENLKKLVEVTDSKLVITSTWRKDVEGRNTLLNALKDYRLDEKVIGYTPILGKTRGTEIKEFLSKLNYEPKFVILDDDTDMEDLLSHLIKVDSQVGLTSKNVEEAIKKLSIVKEKEEEQR